MLDLPDSVSACCYFQFEWFDELETSPSPKKWVFYYDLTNRTMNAKIQIMDYTVSVKLYILYCFQIPAHLGQRSLKTKKFIFLNAKETSFWVYIWIHSTFKNSSFLLQLYTP